MVIVEIVSTMRIPRRIAIEIERGVALQGFMNEIGKCAGQNVSIAKKFGGGPIEKIGGGGGN